MSLWLAEEYWPNEFKGQYFAPRAFQIIGRAIFGDAWTGEEGHAVASPIIAMSRADAERSLARSLGLSRVIKEMRRDRSAWRAKRAGLLPAIRSNDPEKQRRRELGHSEFGALIQAMRDHVEAQEDREKEEDIASIRAQLADRGRMAVERRRRTQLEIARLAAQGDLRSKARAVRLGDRIDVPAKYWDTEDLTLLDQRLGAGRIDTNDPALRAVGGEVSYLFFDRGDVEVAVEQLAGQRKAAVGAGGETASPISAQRISSTGMPGRPPKSRELYIGIMKHRHAQGVTCDKITDEDRAVEAAFNADPSNVGAERATLRTIINTLRIAGFNALRVEGRPEA